ncbi:hypothetical protein HPB47_025692 [Ixodes persulcatus]|uniref:Uncharacterized protein n=1 Tax=Ixodes persulcatus TaxID=34615 RepID=A0AC60Q2U4_IXOPE|nr:hypothetical protein HPB47_025692 [Ixodes persulcatus]
MKTWWDTNRRKAAASSYHICNIEMSACNATTAGQRKLGSYKIATQYERKFRRNGQHLLTTSESFDVPDNSVGNEKSSRMQRIQQQQQQQFRLPLNPTRRRDNSTAPAFLFAPQRV